MFPPPPTVFQRAWPILSDYMRLLTCSCLTKLPTLTYTGMCICMLDFPTHNLVTEATQGDQQNAKHTGGCGARQGNWGDNKPWRKLPMLPFQGDYGIRLLYLKISHSVGTLCLVFYLKNRVDTCLFKLMSPCLQTHLDGGTNFHANNRVAWWQGRQKGGGAI